MPTITNPKPAIFIKDIPLESPFGSQIIFRTLVLTEVLSISVSTLVTSLAPCQKVSAYKVLGTVAIGAGIIMVMNKRDSISPDEFVGMMADTIEGAKAHGHL